MEYLQSWIYFHYHSNETEVINFQSNYHNNSVIYIFKKINKKNYYLEIRLFIYFL